jgi:LemA protein
LNTKATRANRWLIAAPLLVVAGVAAWSGFAGVRAGLAQQRVEIAAAWAELNAVMEERAGQIRALAEAVRPAGAAQAQAAEAACGDFVRSAQPRARIQADRKLSAVLARLLLASDGKPAGKTAGKPTPRPGNQISHLESQIRDSEGRIAEARRKYNESLEHYNARIQSFPHNLVAKIAGFRRNDAYYQTELY